MVNYLSVIQSLWQIPWYWLCAAGIFFFLWRSKSPRKQDDQGVNIFWVMIWALLTFAVFSVAYWYFCENAPHSFSDDVTHTLQTYLNSSLRANAINWTTGTAAGMDRWLLPNCHPASIGRLYGLYLQQPYQLYLLIMAVNVILVFIFSWKIQVEFWQMRPWSAGIGAVIASIVQGYWTGIYPDAHVSQGHGFSIIIVGIYCLTKFVHRRFFGLVCVLVGLAMALGSWTPFHNIMPLVITVAIWGMTFWGPGAFKKVLVANGLILLSFAVVLLPYFLAIKLLFSVTGRSEAFRPSVEPSMIYLWPQMLVLVGLWALAAVLGAFKDKIFRQVLLMFLALSVLPLIAYGFELSKIMPSLRWQLLYAGNDAWCWLAVVFFIDRLQRQLQERSAILGLASFIVIVSSCWVVLSFAWMNSLWLDLISSYPSGNWKSLTDKSVSSVLKVLDKDPVRVVGLDDTNDMHFWGQYQGMEPVLGYTPFIDKRKTFFWWYTVMEPGLHGAYTAAWLSIPIPVAGHERNLDFPVPLPALVNLDALRLANVHWIVSRHPLYPQNDLVKFVDQPGQQAACTTTRAVPTRVDLKALGQYWQDVACLVRDYTYPRPLYVYRIQGALPRVYTARAVAPWPQGQPEVLSPLQVGFAVKQGAMVRSQFCKTDNALGGSTVSFEMYQPDYMRLTIKSSGESLVVLSSTLNAYWKLLVDNQPTSFFDVNGFQTGFWAKAGAREAEFIYCPPFRPAVHPRC